MSTCYFCVFTRFLLKVITMIGIFVIGISFLKWILEHQIEPKLNIPLSFEQQKMKEGFLSRLQAPEILTAKDGTIIYYQGDKKVATATRPDWLDENGNFKLENWQEIEIAESAIVTRKILGFQTNPMNMSSFNKTLIGGIYMLCLYAMLGSMVLGLVLYIKREVRVGVAILLFVLVCLLLFLSINLFLLTATVYITSILIGVSVWPLWTFIDRLPFADYDQKEAG